MNVHRAPTLRALRPGAVRSSATRQVACLCAALLASSLGTSAFGAQVGSDAAQAVMKTQEIKFNYQSFNVFYSCEGIKDKVKRLLLALGATQDLDVQVKACSNSSDLLRDLGRSPGFGGGAGGAPYVIITITSAVEATPTNLAELAKSRPQRELAARVRGDSTAALDAEAQFVAPWKPVSLSRGELGLGEGDCELVEALRKDVLPKIGVRIVKDGLHCSARQGNRFQPQLEVEALIKPPPPPAGSAIPVTEGAATPAPGATSEAPAKPQT